MFFLVCLVVVSLVAIACLTTVIFRMRYYVSSETLITHIVMLYSHSCPSLTCEVLLCLGRAAEYCDQRVHLYADMSQNHVQTSQNFLCVLIVAVAWSCSDFF